MKLFRATALRVCTQFGMVMALGHRAHPHRGPQRECHTARHQERPEAGFFRYLTKPIKVNEFMDTLHEALELAEQGARPRK